MRTPELLFQKLPANGFLWKLLIFFFSQNNSGLHYQKQPPEEVFSIWKMVFLKISQNLLENICVSLFFNKTTCLRPATLYKKRLVQVFSCGFCKIFKNNFLTEHLRMLASQNMCSIKKLPWKVYQNSQEKSVSFMKFKAYNLQLY